MRRTAAAATIFFVGLILTRHGRAFTPQAPRPSPHESVTATIDDAEITIAYGRPSMRGRAIFGTLVPYGRVWCPGADEATTLNSTRGLQIDTLAVPPGHHTIWMLPAADTWTLIVSKEPSGFHTRYPASADLGRIELRKATLSEPPGGIERLTFVIEKNPSAKGGVIKMMWETIEVSAPFTVVP